MKKLLSKIRGTSFIPSRIATRISEQIPTRRHNIPANTPGLKRNRQYLAVLLLGWALPVFALEPIDNLALENPLSAPQQPMVPEAIMDHELSTLNNLFKVHFSEREAGYALVRSYHSEIREVFYEDGYAVMALTEAKRKTLSTLGYSLSPATAWRTQRKAQINQSKTRLQTPDRLSANAESRAAIPGFECYQDVETTLENANSLVAQYGTLATMIDIGDSWNKENGLGGYDLWVLQLTNQEVAGPKPILFIQSAMHAREYATAQLTLDFAERLLGEYNINADSTWILDHHDIRILLHANPDGRKIAETGVLWRKNTNANHCPEALPGVDLNRNYTHFWNFDNLGSSADPCAATFRGTLPASEPETLAVEEYVRSLFADNRGPEQGDAAPLDTSGMHLDIHSFGELILWPWGHTEEPPGNADQLTTLGRKFAYQTNYFPTQAIGLGHTNGTSDEVSYGELGVAAYTFELGTTFFQDCNTYENQIREPNLDALKYAAKVVRAPYQLPSGPEISLFTTNGNQNIQLVQGDQLALNLIADDTLFSDANGAEPSQNVVSVQLFWNTLPWDDNGATLTLAPSDGIADTPFESFQASFTTKAWPLGRHTIYAQATDAVGQVGPIRAVFVDILTEDPENPGQPEIPPDFEFPDGAGLTWPLLISLLSLALYRRKPVSRQ